MTIETIVNNALDQMGYSRHIGSIYEGTPTARVALDLWGQTRDSLLNRMEPDWARKDAKLVQNKVAPAVSGSTAQYDLIPWSNIYPPLPWLYEYLSPSDCVKPLQVKPSVLTLPIWKPRAIPFRHVIDTVETILTNEPNAILIYTARVLDPDLWQNDFTDMMIQLLAQKMQAEFAKHPVQQQQRGQENADAAG